MSDFFKNALNNLTAAWNVSLNPDNRSSSPSSAFTSDNPFIGQTVELNGRKIRIDRLVAEGGFGYVFKVHEQESGQVFALKRLIAADKDAKEEIENEISVLQQLQPHPHIMQFIAFGLIQKNVYLLLSEFCGCGSVLDLKLPIATTVQLNRILFQTALAVQWMHSHCLIHRDLKIENILFDNRGLVKLCDFGSATDKSFCPDMEWTPIQRSVVEDEMQRKTTPMYRPPEILDTYLHLPINTAMDVWAYGCIIYMTKFGRHPFEDSGKLRIINCNYSIPGNVSEETDVHVRLIKSCIKVDPRQRFTMDDVVTVMEQNFVDLNAPIVTPNQPSPAHVPPAPIPSTPPLTTQSLASANPPPVRRDVKPPRPPPPQSTASVQEANLLNLSLDDPSAEPLNLVADEVPESAAEAASLVELLTGESCEIPSAPPVSTSSVNIPSPLKPVAAPTISSSSSMNGNTTSVRNEVSAPKQPHYARSFFSEIETPAKPTATSGVNPKITADQFEDLLQGFTKTASNANTKLAELRNQGLLENGSLDPISLKVREWKENKKNNWTPVGMHQLVDAGDVRKHYLKACLAVHPDKLRGDPNEKLANLIFVELNAAWSEFEKQNKV